MTPPDGSPDLRDRLRVRPGSTVKLSEIDPAETFGYAKPKGMDRLAKGLTSLADLQARLWASREHPVLVVLQGIDAAGKDGTILRVMNAFVPQGCRVVNFGVPSPEELAHDYLWRAHRATPGKGEVVIFDRSYYEDVLVVRVHELVPPDVWAARYAQINAFEAHLAANGTTILKFFLYIDRDEQRVRLQSRIDDPKKRWKFKAGDLEERKRWDEYIAAFEAALSQCSTDAAPWYVIPSNRNWFRNLAVTEIMTRTLDDLDLRYPPGPPGIEHLVVE